MNNLLYKLAERYFCVWENRSDLDWVVRVWGKLRWDGSDQLRKEKAKIYLLALANIYYEFIHEAYSETYELLIEEDIDFLIGECEIKPIDIIELLKEKQIEIGYDYNFEWGVYELVKAYKFEIFGVLCNVYDNIDGLYSALINIKPNLETDTKGMKYIITQGRTFYNILH